MVKKRFCPTCGGAVGRGGRCWRCEPRQYTPRWYQDIRVILVLVVVIAGLLLLVPYALRQVAQPPTATRTTTASYGPPVEVHLGHLSGLDSRGQASKILSMMQQHPDRSGYTISYSTAADTVVFGCDIRKRAIVRIHQRPNGTGTAETWNGYVVDRLQSAAAGGSLNDTPTGKSPGTLKPF